MCLMKPREPLVPQLKRPAAVSRRKQPLVSLADVYELLEAMEQAVLTAAGQGTIIKDRVKTLSTFKAMTPEDFASVGIDIAARKAAREVRALLSVETKMSATSV